MTLCLVLFWIVHVSVACIWTCIMRNMALLWMSPYPNAFVSTFVVCDNRKGGKASAIKKCTTCDGRGVKLVVRQIGPGMMQQMQVTCPGCKSIDHSWKTYRNWKETLIFWWN